MYTRLPIVYLRVRLGCGRVPTFVRAACQQGGLVDQVGQVSSREACGAGSYAIHCDILSQGQALLPYMTLQNLLSPFAAKTRLRRQPGNPQKAIQALFPTAMLKIIDFGQSWDICTV